MKSSYVCNVAIDLEFTPVPRDLQQGGLRQEIIEVGAVKLAADSSVAGEFSHMVKPAFATEVSGVVQRITGIHSEDLTCARLLAEVLDALVTWIGPGRVRMVTWSDCDLKQLRAECGVKGLEWRLPARWLDIQGLYPRLMDMSRRKVALGEAADWCGITNSEEALHRALYDAQLTSEIFRMMGAGECAAHKRAVEEKLSQGKKECAASLGEQCDGLAALLAQLRAKETA